MDDIERRQINNAINHLNDSIRLIEGIRINTTGAERRNWDVAITKMSILVDDFESRMYEDGDAHGQG